MKFTLSWLKDHLETNASVDELVFGLTDLGLEVDSVNDPMQKLGHFVVGEIIQVDQHPDADRLKVCKVAIGSTVQQIICGAPNARSGIKVVVAQPGDYIPGLDTIIKIGKIRGVESHGMMCSERELMLSDEHDGIIELNQDAIVGDRYVDHCGTLDIVIDIAITPNRPDALGVRGVARDLAAKGLGKLKPCEIKKIKGNIESPISISLSTDVISHDCPLFMGRYIKGVKNHSSPKWLQDRLAAIGLRPISALVDITNFITYDRARPLHVFDVSKLSGDLTVRKSKLGESILSLDGSEYQLTAEDTVISSGGQVESIGGIIGGMNSGCEIDTTEVFVESAYFHPISTATTGRRLRINSDARYRFERGVDPLFVETGVNLATQMILDICGGEASKVLIEGEVPLDDKKLILRPERITSLIGMKIEKDEQARILRDLGFQVDETGHLFNVKVPSWRPDIFGEADLIEEIVRVTSLSKLHGKPLKQIDEGVLKPVLTPLQNRIARLRRQISFSGMNECVSYSFIDEKSSKFFAVSDEPTVLINPISSEMTHMRPNLIPGLLQAAMRNQSRSYNDLKLFEVGEIFFGSMPGEQTTHASGVFIGNDVARNSHSLPRAVDVFDAKKVVELALSDMGVSVDSLSVLREDPATYYHPGRVGSFSLGPKNVLASFGELHPKILKHYDIKGPAVAFEIFVENIPFPKHRKLTRASIKISEYQPVERDFSFVVDVGCEVDLIKKAILSSSKELISEARIFDIFEGKDAEKQLGKDKKSVAFMVRLQPLKATFTDDVLETISANIISSVKKASGGSLRS